MSWFPGRSALATTAQIAIALLLIAPGLGTIQSVTGDLGGPVAPGLAPTPLAAAYSGLASGLGPSGATSHPCLAIPSGPGRCPAGTLRPSTSSNESWTQVPNAPLSRIDNQFVYDSTDGYLLSFGGIVTNDYISHWIYVNETWTFADGLWTNLTSTAGPAPPFKLGQVMVDDPSDGCVLLFTTDNQTWTFHGGLWTQLHPSLTPGTLSYESAAFDAYDDHVILFGGGTSRVTWVFHAGNWSSNASGLQPWGRWEGNMAFDGATNQTLLWGGWDYRSGGSVLGTDTWAYQAGNWTEVNTTSSWTAIAGNDPSVYDPASGAVLAFVQQCSGYSTTIYAYANANWSLQQGCTLPDIGGAAFDPDLNTPVAIAGAESYGATSSSWATLWEEGNGTTWTQFYTPPVIPPPTDSAALTEDPSTSSDLSYSYGRTYLYDGMNWSVAPLGTVPSYSQCANGQLTYDTHDGYPLLYCGQLWKYQNGNWSQILQGLTGSWPDVRTGAGFAYDSADGVVVLFGGTGSTGYLNDTWTYSGGNWTNISGSAGPAPPARTELTLVDDPSDGYLLLFGGFSKASWPSGNVTAWNDTWTFSGLRWALVHPARSPSDRYGLMAASDASDSGVLAFGGDAIIPFGSSWTDVYVGDTWQFAAGQWTNVTGSFGPAPDPRRGGAMAPVPGSLQIVLVGGYGSSYQPLLSEWLWGIPPVVGPPSVQVFSASHSATDVGVTTLLTTSILGGARPLTFNYSGLPPGCATIDTARLACTPTSSGTYSVMVHVVDSQGRTTSATLGLTVNPRLVLYAFTVTPASPVSLGSPFVLSVTATGGTGPLGYSYTNAPLGCVSSNAPVMLCTPIALGNYTVAVTVIDLLQVHVRATVPVSIVLPTGRPQLDVVEFIAEPPVVTMGSNLTLATAVQGGNGSLAYQYSGLPAGCVSQNAPAWVCAPTGVGNYTLSVVVTDASLASAFAQTTVSIVAAPPVTNTSTGPVLRVQSFLPLHPSIELGAPIQLTVVLAGGTPPWSISYTGLPAGCASANISVLNCTPTEAGVFLTTVSVNDRRGQQAQSEAIFEVLTPPTTEPHPPPATSNASTTAPFAWSALAAGLIGGALAGACVAVLLARPRRPPDPPPALVL